MILTALNEYYDRLAHSPDADTGKLLIPPYGYSEEKISYILVFSKKGDFVDKIPNVETVGSKIRAKPIFVSMPFIRSGKYTEKKFNEGKDNSFFLWDKTAYSLGVDKNKDKKSDNSWIESSLTFESFKRYHRNNLVNIEDEGLQGFLLFLDKWQPYDFDKYLSDTPVLGENICFQLDGDHCYLHEREAAKKVWKDLLKETISLTESNCLVTGKREKISRLHSPIKGVFGGQTSGGSIVSFNDKSYESYGKIQGENAPVSELAAFKYTTVLKFLLNRENKHCLSVGDASTVFWAVAADGEKTEKAEQLFMQVVNPSDDSEAVKLNPWVEKISQGQPLKEIALEINPSTRFYLLGLAPNAARLSIRYWLDTSFGELAEHMAKHFTDLSLDPPAWKKPPSIFRLLIELVPYRENKKSNAKDIPPHLAGEMMRSILTGDRYPHSLLTQLVLRLRTDGNISSLRIGMIKAVLNRNCRKLNKEGVPMGLDESYDSNAYHTGRLFAVLERIQSSAIKGANATITDRYFGTASTVPYSVFPRLLAGSKNHLSKIRKKMPGYAVNLDKDITRIIAKLPPEFSKHFSIEDQGRFSIGYYHQREKYFTSGASDSEQKDTESN